MAGAPLNLKSFTISVLPRGLPPQFSNIAQLLKRDTDIAGISLKDKNSVRGFLRLANEVVLSQF